MAKEKIERVRVDLLSTFPPQAVELQYLPYAKQRTTLVSHYNRKRRQSTVTLYSTTYVLCVVWNGSFQIRWFYTLATHSQDRQIRFTPVGFGVKYLGNIPYSCQIGRLLQRKCMFVFRVPTSRNKGWKIEGIKSSVQSLHWAWAGLEEVTACRYRQWRLPTCSAEDTSCGIIPACNPFSMGPPWWQPVTCVDVCMCVGKGGGGRGHRELHN